MNLRLLSSIRGRIILLVVLGIAGMVTIAAANKYLDVGKNHEINVGRDSQIIVQHTLQGMMIEEKFINTLNQTLLPALDKLTGEVQALTSGIKAESTDAGINDSTDLIIALSNEHSTLFDATRKNILFIDSTQKELNKKTQELYGHLTKVVEAIDAEAAELLMEGESLDAAKAGLRDEVKTLMTIWNERAINIQNLFIFSDTAAYEEKREAIKVQLDKKLTNLKPLFIIVKSSEFSTLWEKTKALVPLSEETETKLYEAWVKNGVMLGKLKQNGQQVEAAAMEIVGRTKKNIDNATRKGDIASLTVAVIGIGALLLFGTFIARSIVKPIVGTVTMIKDIAEGEGDLTRRLELKSRDEIGDLAKWFDTFIDKIQSIIRKVAENAVQLDDSSTDLSGISEQMLAGSEKTTERANGVAAASEEMSTNMSSVAAAMEEASTNINMVASAAEEMTATINEIAQNAEKARSITGEAVSQADQASNQVEELGTAAQKIGKVIETITEISEQVNLLALNATIEAARAGEAGKGFAVVANEIKELARQTADATDEIKHQVESTQTGITGTVTGIEGITKVVNEVDEIVSTIATAVEEQSVTTREIAENVSQASRGIGEVNENVAQSSNVSSQISAEIADVTQAAGEMNSSSSQVNVNAGDLSSLAGQLNSLVGTFKV